MHQSWLIAQFGGQLHQLGMIEEQVVIDSHEYASALEEKDFDKQFLRPERLVEFCTLINVEPKLLYDNYYTFIFNDIGSYLKLYKQNHKLNDKTLAKKLNISPVDLGLFQN